MIKWILAVILLAGLALIFPLVLLWYNSPIPKKCFPWTKKLLYAAYHPYQWISKFLGRKKEGTIQRFIQLNNRLVFQNQYGFSGKEILVLVPHCIQRCQCPRRITHQVENCAGCGLCSVDPLLASQKRWQFHLKVVTGGTLARLMIQNVRPKAIVAIACERDLSSGILDIKSIPILAITNERPNGPCIDTEVDMEQVNQAIQHFMKE